MTQKKILVVEDEEDIQELVRYNLVKEGYQAHCVGSGEAGLQEARKIFPDLLILDLMLPEMNGLEVCRQLKSDLNTQPIPIRVTWRVSIWRCANSSTKQASYYTRI